MISPMPPKSPPEPLLLPADAPPQRVLRQFRIVFNAVKTHFRQLESESGLGGAQVWALSVIDSQPGIGATSLGRAMDIHQSTASNLVRGLVGRGYVTTTREGSDRRSVALRILPAGQEVLRRAPGPAVGVLPSALATLDEATLLRLEQDLAILIARLDADEEAGKIPLGHS
jgi:DNA-binding MarR family transcriptional regulator